MFHYKRVRPPEKMKQKMNMFFRFYRDDKWYIPHASRFLKKSELEFEDKVAEVFEDKSIEILEGFKPEILDHIHQGKVTYSILDAIETIALLDEQKSNADKVYSALYTMVVYPLFAPALILIIFFFVPISSRSLNVSLFSFLALLIWFKLKPCKKEGTGNSI